MLSSFSKEKNVAYLYFKFKPSKKTISNAIHEGKRRLKPLGYEENDILNIGEDLRK